jgi:hypothetical protein
MYLLFMNVCLCSSVLLLSSRFVCCKDASHGLMKLHFVCSHVNFSQEQMLMTW